MSFTEKRILDACCGSRMFWFDPNNSDAVYMDNRVEETELCDGRVLSIHPDIVADFRQIPFDDESFHMVVFDPPHLLHAGTDSWLAKKYGILQATWRTDLKEGFEECMRVLKPNGTLIFKWCSEQISTPEVIRAIGKQPLIGNRRGKTIWMVFMKGGDSQ